MSGQSVLAVASREFRGYFDQATAYILLVVFLAANFFFFFRTVLVTAEASLRSGFSSGGYFSPTTQIRFTSVTFDVTTSEGLHAVPSEIRSVRGSMARVPKDHLQTLVAE